MALSLKFLPDGKKMTWTGFKSLIDPMSCDLIRDVFSFPEKAFSGSTWFLRVCFVPSIASLFGQPETYKSQVSSDHKSDLAISVGRYFLHALAGGTRKVLKNSCRTLRKEYQNLMQWNWTTIVAKSGAPLKDVLGGGFIFLCSSLFGEISNLT